MHGPKWPFLLILIVYGPSVVFVKYWDRLLIVGIGFIPWVELPVQMRLCPIFMSSVGLPDIHEYSAG